MTRLKVFQAHLGVFDTVVAAPSQKAALEAWGSRQNLFHDETAKTATDQQAVETALANPGVVLKRISGSSDPFVERPRLPDAPGRIRRTNKKSLHESRLRKPAPNRTEADRSKLDAAERAVAELKGSQDRMAAEFARREQALRKERRASDREFDRREQALRDERRHNEQEFERRHKPLEQNLKIERRAFVRHSTSN